MENILTQVKAKVNSLFDETFLTSVAKRTGFMQRERKITAKTFFEGALSLRLNSPQTSLEDFSDELSNLDCHVTKQAIHRKFTPQSVNFFSGILEELLTQVKDDQRSNYLNAVPFVKRVQVIDSSEIRLNNALRDAFPQVRRQGAAVKLQALMDVVHNKIELLDIQASKAPDQGYRLHEEHIQEGDLYIADLGYFRVDTLERLASRSVFFLSRYFKRTNIFNSMTREKIDLHHLLSHSKRKQVELSVNLGKSNAAFRLVAIKLTRKAYCKRLDCLKRKRGQDGRIKNKELDVLDKWTIFITNLPPSVTPKTLMHLYSLRWQIELLFKMMKQFMALKKIEHSNQHRALADLYVSLIAMALLSHVIMTITDEEISLYKAGKVFCNYIREFIACINDRGKCALSWLRNILYNRARKESRPKRPSSKEILRWELYNA